MLSLIKLFKRPGTKYAWLTFNNDKRRLTVVESCEITIHDRRRRPKEVVIAHRCFSEEFPNPYHIERTQRGLHDDFIRTEFASIETSIR